MKRPILVLQYPNPRKGNAPICLAFTRNLKAFRAFKEAVLEEARLDAMDMDWEADEVIHISASQELKRLEEVLQLLIPDENEGVI